MRAIIIGSGTGGLTAAQIQFDHRIDWQAEEGRTASI